jgi:EAL domain-containing protein (putative c-di-GMP-specific phosphodiesterase class I)
MHGQTGSQGPYSDPPSSAWSDGAPILQVLAKRELRVVFQPIVDLKTGSIYAQEALVRPTTPAFKDPPSMFDAAVQSECCGALGRLIRELAVGSCESDRLFLNVHPNELGEGWLVRPDDAIFQHPGQIFLEITESVPLTHFALCNSILGELRSKGVSLVVDDLGAGYSNLKYIADLAPEVVKLDRELIKGLVSGTRQSLLVSSVVRMCADLGASVVAEGIETAEELAAVKDAGVPLGQGYLLARPEFPAPQVRWPIEQPSTSSASSSDRSPRRTRRK